MIGDILVIAGLPAISVFMLHDEAKGWSERLAAAGMAAGLGATIYLLLILLSLFQ